MKDYKKGEPILLARDGTYDSMKQNMHVTLRYLIILSSSLIL